jgi:hypothetical protein
MHLPDAPAPKDPWCRDMKFGSHCPPGVTPETDLTRHRRLDGAAVDASSGAHCSMRTGTSKCAADTAVTAKQIGKIAALASALGIRAPSAAAMDRVQASAWINERWRAFMAEVRRP